MTRREKVKDTMKSKILVVSVILTIGTCLMAISASQSASKAQAGLDQERYNRMVAEEKLEKATAKLVSLQTELDNANTKIKGIQAVLDQGRSTNADLKAQLETVTKLKATLERRMEDLKNAQAMPIPIPMPTTTQTAPQVKTR